MTLGLYDIDLWHGRKSVINLELMKVYNYYKQKGHIVIMMRPDEDEGRFNKIIYFKDNPNTQIPRRLILNDNKKETYGYGFYNKYTMLLEEIQKTKLSYEPYDIYSYKLKKIVRSYDQLKRSSLIRLESNDFLDYKKEARNMVFVDHNFFYQENAYDCLLDFKNHTYFFAYPLIIKDSETFYKFERFINIINNHYLIDFRFDEEFFFDNIQNNKIVYNLKKRENETLENYKQRIIKMGLFYKARGKVLYSHIYDEYDEIISLIFKWIKTNTTESFEKYNGTVPENISSEIRLLLKQDPKKINNSHLDFYKNL